MAQTVCTRLSAERHSFGNLSTLRGVSAHSRVFLKQNTGVISPHEGVEMRRLSWLVLWVVAFSAYAHAAETAKRKTPPPKPTTAAKPAAPAPYKPVELPVPPGAKVTMELNLTENDLLGTVKSLLSSAKIEVSATPSNTGNEKKALKPEEKTQTLDIGKILRGLRGVRVVMYTAPKVEGSSMLDHYVSFYEKPFTQKGGRRMFWLSEENERILVMWFDKPTSVFFALAQEEGEGVEVIAARTDGMIDVQALMPILSGMGSGNLKGINIGIGAKDAKPETEKKEK